MERMPIFQYLTFDDSTGSRNSWQTCSMNATPTVEQGSTNYTRAANESNAENVPVSSNNAKLAEVHLRDWQRHWDHSETVAATY